jgi:hypothetical protein
MRRLGLASAYFEFGPRPFREARLRSYIIRQHRAGRPLQEILEDPYVSRCGSPNLAWRVLEHPRTLEALFRNDVEAAKRFSEQLTR